MCFDQDQNSIRTIILQIKIWHILLSKLFLNEKFQISRLDEVELDYLDDDKQKNSIRLKRNKKKYFFPRW